MLTHRAHTNSRKLLRSQPVMALSVGDLKVLLQELYPARIKWYETGLLLDVPVATLESIKSENKDDLGACLRETLLYALKNGDLQSWKQITDTLMVGEGTLSDTLSNKYCLEGTGGV